LEANVFFRDVEWRPAVPGWEAEGEGHNRRCCEVVGECIYGEITGTIETKGAHAMRDLPEDKLGVVGGLCHLSITDVEQTEMNVDIKQQGFRLFMHDANPE
jgi:hypothetical protein